jgi:hypothetical protein
MGEREWEGNPTKALPQKRSVQPICGPYIPGGNARVPQRPIDPVDLPLRVAGAASVIEQPAGEGREIGCARRARERRADEWWSPSADRGITPRLRPD